MTPPILMLGVDGDSTRIVYNRLAKEFGQFQIIIESPVSRMTLLRTRIRKLGLPAALSQIAFLTLIRPLLERSGKRRIENIKSEFELDSSPVPLNRVLQVPSINAPETMEQIKRIDPKVIVVNGTRIIARTVLGCTAAPFINTHSGITPQYRGAHGGYWALYNDDLENCGVTVHLVDPGIDTGNIVDRALIKPTNDDSFVTYPYLQIAAGLPILIGAVRGGLDDTLKARPSAAGKSAVWYHPGFFQYLRARLHGVR